MNLELNDFTYPSSAQAISFNGTLGLDPNFSAQGANVKDPGQWPAEVIFRNDILRSDEQKGVFGEVTFNVSDTFSIIAGARWYDVEVDLQEALPALLATLGRLRIIIRAIIWTHSSVLQTPIQLMPTVQSLS